VLDHGHAEEEHELLEEPAQAEEAANASPGAFHPNYCL
jgi:hypothetical protein